MNKPTLTINGNKIEMPKVKARVWREIVKFDSERKTIPVADYVDKHCEIIALIFGVDKDTLLDNIDISDIIPVYTQAVTYLLKLLYAKTTDDKKNEEMTAET